MVNVNFMNEYTNKINNLSNYTNLEKHDFSNKLKELLFNDTTSDISLNIHLLCVIFNEIYDFNKDLLKKIKMTSDDWNILYTNYYNIFIYITSIKNITDVSYFNGCIKKIQ